MVRLRESDNSVCLGCGSLFYRSASRVRKYCSRTCYNDNKRSWRMSTDGYIITQIDGKQIKQHRYLMELYLGRKLKNTEMIHHINGIKTDNRIGNLKICTAREHYFIHELRNEI